MGGCKKNSHIQSIHFILQKVLLPLFADIVVMTNKSNK